MNFLKRLWRSSGGMQVWFECIIAAILFMMGLFRLRVELGCTVVGQGLFYVTIMTALWSAARWRTPNVRSKTYHLLLAFSFSAALGSVFHFGSVLFHLNPFWASGNHGRLVLLLSMIASGPLFLGARLFFNMLIKWNVLRQRRLRWAIMHGHIMLLLTVLGMWTVWLSLHATRSASTVFPEAGIATTMMARLLVNVFPIIAIVVVTGFFLIIIFFTPLAFVAYRISNPVIKRIEALAKAVKAFREGHHSTRLIISGKDEIATLESDFNTLAASLDDALKKLTNEKETVSALLDERRQLIATVSHELRTPVAILSAHLENMQHGRTDDLSLDVIRQEVKRLDGLIEDLFTLAQAETRSLEIRLSSFDILPLIKERVTALKEYAWQRNRVEIITHLPEICPLIMADPRRLDQILINLLRNGIDHTQPGGLVSISIKSDDTMVYVSVADTGAGIAENELNDIWVPFWRGKHQMQHSGAGLGLALVKELVEAMHGSVSVTSKLNEGSCFMFNLPL
ncbi:HAMP domain-containing histidine kinase [bacterium]|nr:HAMP domain-containing histidine kinase [bacterium]